MPEVLGLDIGGANIKAAHSRGVARTCPFALWRNPQGLTAVLRAVVAGMPWHEVLAVTMTGELCDCYATKREGVGAILDSVAEVAGRIPVWAWSTYGQFLQLKDAREEPLRVGAANWLAGAALAGRHADAETALFIDIGSTTTDIIELWRGKPVPNGWTDVERMRLGELVYTGVRRAPLCALLGPKVAAELFATTLDAYLALGLVAEDESDDNTADGRPATKACAHGRLARMLGGDAETVATEETTALARLAMDRQVDLIRSAIAETARRMPEPPQVYVVAGSGTFLARRIVAAGSASVVCLDDVLSPQLSEALCAYAIAVLAQERGAG